MLTQNEAMGAATASDGERAPIASFWVRIMTSCINIKRGVVPREARHPASYIEIEPGSV